MGQNIFALFLVACLFTEHQQVSAALRGAGQVSANDNGLLPIDRELMKGNKWNCKDKDNIDEKRKCQKDRKAAAEAKKAAKKEAKKKEKEENGTTGNQYDCKNKDDPVEKKECKKNRKRAEKARKKV